MNNNKIKILILISTIFKFFLLYGKEPVSHIISEDIVIINTNVAIYCKPIGNINIIKVADFLNVFKVKGNKIINGRIEIYTENGNFGWINVSETSYIKNLGWKRFDRIKGLEIYLPPEYKFNFETHNLPENELGKWIQYDFVNPNLYIKIYYGEEREEFNITNLYLEDVITEDMFKKMVIQQTEAYYGEFNDSIESGLVHQLFLIEKGRKKSFSIAAIFDRFNQPVNIEQQLIARKILFSARIIE
ncbi:MAG: hypothetical protein N2169_07905 [bacterium]|nr:hypothetical protein [bacterium]